MEVAEDQSVGGGETPVGEPMLECAYLAFGDPLPRPLLLSRTPAGFPSPAEDHIDRDLDLNEHLIRRPAATFFVRVFGISMIGAGINDGALLIVDRS